MTPGKTGNIGWLSAEIHPAIKLGVWERPHPNPEFAGRLKASSTLYERPPESCRVTSLRERSIDFEGNEIIRELPAVDPVLGGSIECDGCGEPFGKQVRINAKLSVSLPATAYRASGLPPEKEEVLNFCQDQFRCSRLASDRIGSDHARGVTLREAQKLIAETTGARIVPNDEGTRPPKVCAFPGCSTIFDPVLSSQEYCGPRCRQDAKLDLDRAARIAAGKIPRGPRKNTNRRSTPKTSKQAAEAAGI